MNFPPHSREAEAAAPSFPGYANVAGVCLLLAAVGSRGALVPIVFAACDGWVFCRVESNSGSGAGGSEKEEEREEGGDTWPQHACCHGCAKSREGGNGGRGRGRVGGGVESHVVSLHAAGLSSSCAWACTYANAPAACARDYTLRYAVTDRGRGPLGGLSL